MAEHGGSCPGQRTFSNPEFDRGPGDPYGVITARAVNSLLTAANPLWRPFAARTNL
jgi:hypothetical protein